MQHLFLTVLFVCFFISCKNESKDFDTQKVNKENIVFTNPTVEYLNINGTSKQYKDAYDQMFYVLKHQVNVSSLSEDYLKNIQKKGKKEGVNEIINLLVPVYEGLFSKEEIKGMLQFYKTETGKQLVNDSSVLTEEQKKEVTKFYKSSLMIGVSKKHDSLTKIIAEVSEQWSKDLYIGTKAMIEAEIKKQEN